VSNPFRESRLNPSDVRQILKRALELAEHDPATRDAQRSLTRAELEHGAGELGLPGSAVTAAMRSTERAPASKRRGFLGGPTRILLEEEVEGEPSDSDREDLVEELRDAMGEAGTFESVGKTFTWKLASGNGRGRELSVRFRSRDGRTRIVVEERLVRQAMGLFVGIGVGGGIGPMGGYIAAVMALGPIALLLPVFWISLMLLLARTIFGALSRRRERALQGLLDRVMTRAAAWSGVKATKGARVEGAGAGARVEAGAGARVEAGAGARVEAAEADASAEAEAEADAEAEAAEADARAAATQAER
jgi:hypothetical protein